MKSRLGFAALFCAVMAAGVANADWGAVGIQTDGPGYGAAWNFTDEQSAYDAVWEECGGYCDEIFTVFNACAAIAQAGNGAWGFSPGSSRAAAESNALDVCYQYGGNSCRVRARVCSG